VVETGGGDVDAGAVISGSAPEPPEDESAVGYAFHGSKNAFLRLFIFLSRFDVFRRSKTFLAFFIRKTLAQNNILAIFCIACYVI